MRLADLRDRLRTTLWFIPSLCVAASVLLVWATDMIDRRFPELRESVRVVGSNASAETVLTTIATSMISLTALVFSITVVVLQLASTQFSPRVLRTFLRDRRSQFALGVFVATFVYSLVTLRSVGTQSEEFIPQISVGAAFALVILSLGVFVMYINNIAQSIRVASIVKSIGDETREVIEELYPPDLRVPDVRWSRPPRAHQFYESQKGGVIISVDEDDLVEWARDHDCVLELLQAIGDFVPKGQRVLARYGGGAKVPLDPSDFISVAHERTMRQDIAFGFRQLVDIAERALSPAINDPTTAVQSIDQMHDLLRRLAGRPFPGPFRVDSDGDVRLVMQAMRWEGYVSLAMDEIRQYEGRSLQVARRFRAMINDLLIVVDDDRRSVLERELDLLDEAVTRQFPDAADRRAAARPDEQGIGY
ncbi:MAG: DUF2254 domain-containing protein [Actinomycetota bacterium]